MSAADAAYTVALLIGVGVVGWAVDRIVALGERITRLEAVQAKCRCSEEGHPST